MTDSITQAETFGDPSDFAIEAMLEANPVCGPEGAKSLLGRFRVWICQTPIGDIEEPSCYFYSFHGLMVQMRDELESLWDPAFDDLTPEQIYDLLDEVYYGAHRGELLSDDAVDTSVVPEAHRFAFLTNWSEVFDGWKAFLVCPPGPTAICVVSGDDAMRVDTLRFPSASFAHAVLAFDKWLRRHQLMLF